MEETRRPYWLPGHVYMCHVGEAVIFLDVKRDKYQALQGDQMRALGAVVNGWPVAAPAGCEDFAQRLARKMVEAGLLTPDAATGKPATPVALHVDEVPIAAGLGSDAGRSIRISDVYNFLVAWGVARATLRWGGLEASIRAVRARKRTLSTMTAEQARVEQLVCLFRRLRCYFFSVRGRCLIHSLVMVHFLARYGVFPTFVMGVRLRPHDYHAWLQHGALVLDDRPAHVANFTPILAE